MISKRNNTTIQGKLKEYLKMIMTFLVLILFVAAGFCTIVTVNTVKSNEQQLRLNDYYDQLDQVQQLVYDKMMRAGLQSEESMQESFHRLQGLLASMEKAKINAEYERSMEDLAVLMGRYERLLKQIQEDESNLETVNEVEALYELMNSYSRPVYLLVLKHNREVLKNLLHVAAIYVSLLLTVLIIYAIYIILKTVEIIRGITNPIQQLTLRLCSVSLLDNGSAREMPELPEYHEEIIQMLRGYNQMLETNRKQLSEHEELMNTKLLLQKQELLNLQQQINPHFLFNTLNMISHSAYLENDRKVVSLIEITANLLRYSLDFSSREVTLGQEIEAVGNYVSIQEQRFEDRILFRFDLDESFHQVRLPSLILQPLVENAVVHGIGAYETGGEIVIRTRYDREKRVGRISVIDNGEGMEEEKLQEVKKKMCSSDESHRGIGLANVYFRLQIFFEGNADIEIHSEPRHRTEIALLVPYGQDGEENVYACNRR